MAEYGDSIYNTDYFAKADPAKEAHLVEQQFLLDKIEALKAIIVKATGRKIFHDTKWLTLEAKCKSLRQSLTRSLRENESLVSENKKLKTKLKRG
jgi:hypothetical protein